VVDDRPSFTGHVPAAGAPLTSRTLALRPQQQSLSQGDLTSSDAVANAVYGWLQGHPGLGVPEQGQENLASFAGGVNRATPWGSLEEARVSAGQGDFPGVVTNLLGAVPIIPGAKAAGVVEDVAGTLAKRAEPIIAYHGSPYSFDRFDISKIGTGEGAQAYGHGLYFAQNEDTARAYRYMAAHAPAGQNPASAQLALQAKSEAEKAGLSGDDAKQYAMNWLNDQSKPVQSFTPQRYYDAMNNYDALTGGPDAAGHMYQVGINADPDSFLDWDKPLSQQSPTVQQALSGIVSPQDAAAYHFGYDPDEFASLPVDRQSQLIAQTPSNAKDALLPQSGSEVLSKLGGGPDAAQTLRDMGVSGVKYLDQGSRGVGDGTSNYVVFNDSTIDILKKYGLAGLGTAGGAAALTAAGQSPVSSPAEAAPSSAGVANSFYPSS
jgi:hypothetical protein